MGYKHAGELKDCGYKFNRWYALLYMDKQIGIPQEEMPPIRDFDEVQGKIWPVDFSRGESLLCAIKTEV